MTGLELTLPRPGAWTRSSAKPTTLQQCLLLALLLHVLAVVLLGSTPGGSAKPGEGVWGPLDITLQGVLSDGGAASVTSPDTPNGPAGDARSQRFGGAVRDEAAPAAPAKTPGAARLGRWQAAPSTSPPRTAEPMASPVPEAAVPTREETLPADAAPKSPDRAAPPPAPSVEPSVTPSAMQVPPPRLDVPAPAVVASPAAPVPEVTRAPSHPPAPVGPVAPLPVPALERRVPPQTGIAIERTAPVPSATPFVPAPAPFVPAPVTPAPAPFAEQHVAAPAVLPADAQVPATPAPAARPVAPIATPLPATPPPLSPPMTPPAAAPLSAPAATTVTPTVPTTAAPSTSAAVTPKPESSNPATSSAPSDITPSTPSRNDAAQRTPGAANPRTAASPSASGSATASPNASTNAVVGAPDAGTRLGHDIATSPSAAASTPAPLNLSLPSLRGGDISNQRSNGVFQMMPHPPEQKSRLADDIDKAAKPDCRTAYAGAGLLAVVPLVADAVKGTGCKW